MICIISSSYNKAEKWAETQNLLRLEWFFVTDISDVISRTNFHVIVIGEFEDHKLPWFEKIYSIAKRQGSINRV